jgi:hypothetical protein
MLGRADTAQFYPQYMVSPSITSRPTSDQHFTVYTALKKQASNYVVFTEML